MSRSRKKHPITGIARSVTEKEFKQQEHSRERAAVRDAIQTEKELLPHPKKFGNRWSGPKDGRTDWTGSDYEEKAKRK